MNRQRPEVLLGEPSDGSVLSVADPHIVRPDALDSPLVSVLVSNYNYGEFVGRALESALAQTYDRVEVLVVDDGSTDRSAEVIGRFGGRIRSLIKDHEGWGAAFNAALPLTSGEIVCLLDADDEFLPDKVERVVAAFRRHPDATACFHARVVRATAEEQLVPLGASGPVDARDAMQRGQPPFIATTSSALAFRRWVLERLAPLPVSEGVGVQELGLKWGALALGTVVFLDEPLTVQHVHGRNAYTGRKSPALQAEVLLRNAAWVRERLPGFERLADNAYVWARRGLWPERLRALVPWRTRPSR